MHKYATCLFHKMSFKQKQIAFRIFIVNYELTLNAS